MRLRDVAAPGVTIVRQCWSNDCGPAALAMVAAHYGRSGVDEALDQIALDHHGTDLLALSRLASSLGFRTRGIKASYDAIGTCPLPAIVHVRRRFAAGHFVVVRQWTATHVVIADPASGLRRLSRRAFCRRASGYVLILSLADAEAADA